MEKAVNNFKLFDRKIGKTSKIPPSFYCVLTGVGGVLEKIDNVYFIPFDLLGC
ncbi:hypothetical protein FACS189459_1290 [Bacilli bacterium]|nr:hypothetical protein FACS189459_1290 [Bacilli bacterium]